MTEEFVINIEFLNRFICLVKFHSKYFNCSTDNIFTLSCEFSTTFCCLHHTTATVLQQDWLSYSTMNCDMKMVSSPSPLRCVQQHQGGHHTSGIGGKRKLQLRVKEHRSETEKVSKGTNYTRDKKKLSQSEMWGSAITDHAMQENHLIDWESARIIEKERDDKQWCIQRDAHDAVRTHWNID